MRVRAYPDRTNGTNVHESTCSAPRCHQPVTDGYLCRGCTDLARDQLRALAGHPTQAPEHGPHRTAARPPGPWRDEVFTADSDTPHRRGVGQLLAAPDIGLLAELELTETRQDVAEPDTSRPVEITEDDEPRTKDRPIGATPSVAHWGAGHVLARAHRDLRRWVRLLIEDRHGAELDQYIRALAEQRAASAAGLPSTKVASPVQLPDATSPRELALWLGRHLNDLRQHVAAGEIAAGIDDHRQRAEKVLNGEDKQFAGICPDCDRRGVFAPLWCDTDATSVPCWRCHTVHDVAKNRDDLYDRAKDQRLSAPALTWALSAHVRELRDRYELTENDLPFSADVIRGYGRHGRIARYEPTKAERDAGTVREVRFKVSDVMAVIEKVAEDRQAKIDKRRGARAS